MPYQNFTIVLSVVFGSQYKLLFLCKLLDVAHNFVFLELDTKVFNIVYMDFTL